MSDILSVGLGAMQSMPEASQAMEPAEVSLTDKEKFEAAIQSDNTQEPVPVPSVGDAVVDGLASIKSYNDQKLKEINETSDINDPTFQELLKLQTDMSKLSMRGELVARASTRMNQNLDTLMKSQ